MSVPHSPEQNGVAERMNHTLMESARSMLSHAGLSNRYWAEAVATAAYIRNCIPTAAIKEGQTPYERWYGKKPNVSHLKVFGCMAFSYCTVYSKVTAETCIMFGGVLALCYYFSQIPLNCTYLVTICNNWHVHTL